MRLNKKEKIKKNIKTCLLLLILIFLIIFICTQIQQRKELKSSDRNYLDDKICPRNLTALYSNYKGENDRNDLYRHLENFVNYLNEISNDIKEFNQKDLENFYKENKSEILEKIGIMDKEEFVIFAKYIKDFKLYEKEYKYCEIDKESFIEDNDKKYLTFQLDFIYGNTQKEEKMKLKVHFSNSNLVKPIVKYSVIN